MLSIPKYPEQYAQHFPTIFYLLCCASQHHVLSHGEVKPHVQCSHRFPSFGHFVRVWGPFWAKNGCFGAQNAQFWEGTSRLGAPAPGRHR